MDNNILIENISDENVIDEEMSNENTLTEDMEELSIRDTENTSNENTSSENTSSENTCSICLQNILINNLCITNCNHQYCKECIDNWFNTGKDTCPMCRKTIKYFRHQNINNRIIYITENRNQNTNRQQNNNANSVTMPLTTYNFIKNYCFLMAILLGFSGFYILNGGNCNYHSANLTHLEN